MIPLEHAIAVAAILFCIGLFGVLVRTLLLTLMSIEVMLNASALMCIIAEARWRQSDGQVFFMFILATAAAEVAVGLSLSLLLNRVLHTQNSAASTKEG